MHILQYNMKELHKYYQLAMSLNSHQVAFIISSIQI